MQSRSRKGSTYILPEEQKIRVPVASYRRYSIDLAFPLYSYNDKPRRKFTEDGDFQLVFQKSFNGNNGDLEVEFEDDDYADQFLHCK